MRHATAILLLALLFGPSDAQSPGSSKDSTPSGPPPVTSVGGKTLAQWRDQLKSEDASLRADAIVAIMQFGDAAADAVPDLLDQVADQRDVSPRAKAIYALRMIDVHDKHVRRVVNTLADRLVLDKKGFRQEAQAVIRLEAIYSLSRYTQDGKPAVDALISASKDSASWEIRHQAIGVLWRVGADNRSPEQGPDANIVTALLDAVKRRDNTHKVKLEALIGLAVLGKPLDTAVQERLVKELTDVARGPSEAYRTPLYDARSVWAYAALTHMGENPGTSKLAPSAKLSSYLKFKNLETRCQALAAIGTLGKGASKHLPELVEMLDHKELVVAQAACAAIRQIGETSGAVSKLVELIGHKEPQRAIAAIQTLVALKQNTSRVIEALEAIKTSKDTDKYLDFFASQALETLKKQAEAKKKP